MIDNIIKISQYYTNYYKHRFYDRDFEKEEYKNPVQSLYMKSINKQYSDFLHKKILYIFLYMHKHAYNICNWNARVKKKFSQKNF